MGEGHQKVTENPLRPERVPYLQPPSEFFIEATFKPGTWGLYLTLSGPISHFTLIEFMPLTCTGFVVKIAVMGKPSSSGLKRAGEFTPPPPYMMLTKNLPHAVVVYIRSEAFIGANRCKQLLGEGEASDAYSNYGCHFH